MKRYASRATKLLAIATLICGAVVLIGIIIAVAGVKNIGLPIAKLEIALKESNETSYWLKLMYETKRIDLTTYRYTEKLCGNIRRLLIASCKTAKGNLQ